MTKADPERLLQTREAAVHFSEDYDTLVSIVERAETRPMDLRHACVIVRRLLVEDELIRVAAPRVGRVKIVAIDNNPVYRAERSGRIVSFVSGGALIHGVWVCAGMQSMGTKPPDLTGFNPEPTIQLPIDSFLKQRVILTEKVWITRRQVIKFIANIGRGVHAIAARTKEEELLSKFKNQHHITMMDDPTYGRIPAIGWSVDEVLNEDDIEKYDPFKVNGILVELLATIRFMVESPDVIALNDAVKLEIDA